MASFKEMFKAAAEARGYDMKEAELALGYKRGTIYRTLRSSAAAKALQMVKLLPPKQGKKTNSLRDYVGDPEIVITYKLPEEGRLLQQGSHKLRVLKHLSETDVLVDVQYNGIGPWYRKRFTINPHNRLNWMGLWEAPKRAGGKR